MARGDQSTKRDPKGRNEYGLLSRCYPGKFRKIMLELTPLMSQEHHDALKKTPFYSYMGMPKISYSMTRVQALIQRYREETNTFLIGENIEVPFLSSEFSIVMGLHDQGYDVHRNVNLKKMKSETLSAHFNDSLAEVTRENIVLKLRSLVRRSGDANVQDFVRMYVLFVFNCLLFPTKNMSTPGFLIPIVDKLSQIEEFAWGSAVHGYLVEQICKYRKKGGQTKNINGCMLGLLVSIT